MTEETGGVFGWGMFNVQLAAGMLREAAAQAYGLVGEVIPSDVPGKLAMGVRAPAGVVVGDRAVERAGDPRARASVATPLAYAQHGRAEGLGDLPADARRDRRARWSTPACRRASINLITNDAGRRRRRSSTS